DAGANVGYTAVLEALAVGARGRVIAFEPNPHVFPILKENINRNGLSDRVRLHAAALSDTGGRMALSMPVELRENDGLASLYQIRPGAHSVLVDVARLDDVFTGEAALMKVDVEGAEAHVFNGASRL